MPYAIETITAKGAEIFATLADRLPEHLTITGCYAVKDVVDSSTALGSGNLLNTSAWNNTDWVHTTIVEMSGVTTDTENNTSSLMVYIQFKSGSITSHGTWDTNNKLVRTFYLHGHTNTNPNTEYVLAVASDTRQTRMPENEDIVNYIEIRFTLTFTPLDVDSTITVPSNNDYVLRSEYESGLSDLDSGLSDLDSDLQTLADRVVTTHAEGSSMTGENQDVYGIKKFLDPVDFFGVAKAYTYTLSGLNFLSFALTDSTGSPNFLYGPNLDLYGSRASETGFISCGGNFVGNTTFDGPVANVSVRASEESGSKVSEINMFAKTGSSSSDQQASLTLTPTAFTVNASTISVNGTATFDNDVIINNSHNLSLSNITSNNSNHKISLSTDSIELKSQSYEVINQNSSNVTTGKKITYTISFEDINTSSIYYYDNNYNIDYNDHLWIHANKKKISSNNTDTYELKASCDRSNENNSNSSYISIEDKPSLSAYYQTSSNMHSEGKHNNSTYANYRYYSNIYTTYYRQQGNNSSVKEYSSVTLNAGRANATGTDNDSYKIDIRYGRSDSDKYFRLWGDKIEFRCNSVEIVNGELLGILPHPSSGSDIPKGGIVFLYFENSNITYSTGYSCGSDIIQEDNWINRICPARILSRYETVLNYGTWRGEFAKPDIANTTNLKNMTFRLLMDLDLTYSNDYQKAFGFALAMRIA